MGKNNKNNATSNVNAMNAAIQDMKLDGIDVAPVDTLTAETATLPVDTLTAETATLPVATLPDMKTAFLLSAVSVLSSGNVSSVPVSVVLSHMVSNGFTFPVKGESDKAPKGKEFALCGSEKTANTLYKFLVSELRTKSSVSFTGALKGKTLYYNSCNVHASEPLPVDSVNAWKEAFKLSVNASGK